MRASLPLAALGGLLLVAPRAAAWNDVGHFTVAKLAWDRLDPGRRAAACDTLRHLPHLKRFLAEHPRPAGVGEPEWLFLTASTWPDWLRGFQKAARQGDAEAADIFREHRGPWHYIDLPYFLPDEAHYHGRRPDPWARSNVVRALERYVPNDLRGDDPARRATALCWLLHLVADVHQPLHCTTLYSDEYRAGDMGGNLRWVKAEGVPISLHSFWDNLPGGFERPADAAGLPAYFAKVAGRARENARLLDRPPYLREQFARELKKVRPAEWAVEGHALGVRGVYREGKVPGIRIHFRTGAAKAQALRQEAPPLSPDYLEASARLADRQLALAAHRLTDELSRHLPKAGGRP